MANYGINAPVHSVTPRACARVAPVWPARYALRWTDETLIGFLFRGTTRGEDSEQVGFGHVVAYSMPPEATRCACLEACTGGRQTAGPDSIGAATSRSWPRLARGESPLGVRQRLRCVSTRNRSAVPLGWRLLSQRRSP